MVCSVLVFAGCQPTSEQSPPVTVEMPAVNQSDAPPLSEREVQTVSVASPDGQNVMTLRDEGGLLRYTIKRGGEDVIGDSRLGLQFLAQHGLYADLRILSTETSTFDTTWEQPWGERRMVRDCITVMNISIAKSLSVNCKWCIRLRPLRKKTAFTCPSMRQRSSITPLCRSTNSAKGCFKLTSPRVPMVFA